jgi:hypothetical protein
MSAIISDNGLRMASFNGVCRGALATLLTNFLADRWRFGQVF